MITEPSRQALAAEDRSLPNRVTGRLHRAIIAMVWEGARRADAAKSSGMTDHSLRAALRKPHVIGFYRAELGTLRESERSRTLHRLCDIRDQDSNKMASVAASKALEQISDTEVKRPPGVPFAPGLIIQVINAPSPAPRHTIDVTPASVRQTEGSARIEADSVDLSEQDQ
jgi:hypothetical protein